METRRKSLEDQLSELPLADSDKEKFRGEFLKAEVAILLILKFR